MQDHKLPHLTSCRLAVWQQFTKPLLSLAQSVKKAGMDQAKPKAMGVQTTVNKVVSVSPEPYFVTL